MLYDAEELPLWFGAKLKYIVISLCSTRSCVNQRNFNGLI